MSKNVRYKRKSLGITQSKLKSDEEKSDAFISFMGEMMLKYGLNILNERNVLYDTKEVAYVRG